MKKALILASLLFILEKANSQSHSQTVNDDFKKLDWLEGEWKRLNVKPGRTAYESWQKISADEWKGSGINMKGTDTSFIEKLKLIIKDGVIYYVADIAENGAPVYFRLTMITGDSFVCENAEHDFPKKIAYQKEGNKIKASISANGKSIEYLFEKISR